MKVVCDLSLTGAPLHSKEGWHPGWLFRGGAQGVWLDPAAIDVSFVEHFGQTPLGATDQPLGLLLDRSKNLEKGAELAANCDFSMDTSWFKGTGWSISGGQAVADDVQSGRAILQDVPGMTEGGTYEVRVSVDSVSQGALLVRCGVSGTPSATMPSAGDYVFRLRCDGNTFVYLSAFGNTTAAVNSISIKLLEGTHARQVTSAARGLWSPTPRPSVSFSATQFLRLEMPAWTAPQTIAFTAPDSSVTVLTNQSLSEIIDIGPGADLNIAGFSELVVREGDLTTDERNRLETWLNQEGVS